jgi:hypothetical protein
MGKIKETDFTEYSEEEPLLDDEDELVGPELPVEDEDVLLDGEESVYLRRTWRDTEKYNEMRELYKIINDDLYTGFEEDEFPDENE